MAVAFAGNSTAIQEMFKRRLGLLQSKTAPPDHRGEVLLSTAQADSLNPPNGAGRAV